MNDLHQVGVLETVGDVGDQLCDSDEIAVATRKRREIDGSIRRAARLRREVRSVTARAFIGSIRADGKEFTRYQFGQWSETQLVDDLAKRRTINKLHRIVHCAVVIPCCVD